MTIAPASSAHRFAHQAMATEFEIYCAHADRDYAQQAAWAAFDLLDRLEAELSLFVENSDIARINGMAAGETTRVSRWTMECLRIARMAYAETGGAFDISLGTGLDTLQLSPLDSTVRTHSGAVRLDLGGIGKGYAVDRMAEVLLDWDIRQALIHGGYSSVLALDAPAGCEGWPLTLSVPGGEPFHTVRAKHLALSASGVRKGDHILDPRSGQPARLRLAAWAAAATDGALPASQSPSAVVEAFSTAFMILPAAQVEAICARFPGLQAWLLEEAAPPRAIYFDRARTTSCI
jgi:thiamine biosynthesis lipoprotein